MKGAGVVDINPEGADCMRCGRETHVGKPPCLLSEAVQCVPHNA